MAQPVKHTADAMLDAARALVIAGGPSAASARAVATAIGAPSGSIYHRFPRRDDLVAASWLRAQDRFLEDYMAHLDQPTIESAVAAAVSVLTWAQANEDDARLLLRYSLRDLLQGEVSPGLASRAEASRRLLERTLTGLARATGQSRRDVLLTVVDLPYAVARRALTADAVPSSADVAAVRRAAALLLSQADPGS
jgi:AcrR family transcriptional regulator